LRRYGVPVPLGEMAQTPESVRKIALQLGTKVVIKAQIHAGGGVRQEGSFLRKRLRMHTGKRKSS